MTGRFEPRQLTAEEVRVYRDQTGCGMMEAKHILHTALLKEALDDLQANGTLEDKVDFLLSRYGEKL